MTADVYIVGIGMTPFGAASHKSVRQLSVEAVNAALADAGCTPEAIGASWFANVGQGALEGQHAIRGQLALSGAGLHGLPIVNVENACASASTALHAGVTAIQARLAQVALVVGCEKLCVGPKQRAFDLLSGCRDVLSAHPPLTNMTALGPDMAPATADIVPGTGRRSVFMEVYAALARHHMQRFGTTVRQIAAVAAKNHRHSVHNPLAQYRSAMSIEEILAAREVIWPLTIPMCAPLSDGAAAAVICSREALGRFDSRRAVAILATILASGSATRTADEAHRHVCHLAAQRAYECAGLGPEDMSVAEVHDATAFAEILQTENLMFCELGAGGPLAESGTTSLGGRIPVNPSGGLVSKGHPIGATGLGQVFELVTQLRGEAGPRQVEGARFAIAENGGGLVGVEEAAACVTILGSGGAG